MSDSREKIGALVVSYFPDQDFFRRVEVIASQVDLLIIADNTPEPEHFSPSLQSFPEHISPRLEHILNGKNLGLATALNQGLRVAARHNCSWLLTLDQDSLCFPDAIATLVKVKDLCNPPPMVIGGNYFDRHNNKPKVSTNSANEWLEQTTVITSGSLINVAFALKIGGFRDDYFIDQIDHEFCLRTRAHGGKVVISRKPVMEHGVGTSDGAFVPFLGRMPGHSATRKYYIARNSLVTIANYWRTEFNWAMRRAIRLALGLILMATLEKQRTAKVMAFFRGIRDGFRRHMGPMESHGK